MAFTVAGAVGGTSVSFATNTIIQQVLAQTILNAAGPTTTAFVNAPVFNITTATTIDQFPGASVVTGNISVANANILLNSQFGTYVTGGTTNSTVVAADNTNSSVVNTNPFGNLIASTGAGGNVLYGAAGGNQFFTGVGGQDLVILNGSSNTLVSAGSDAVLVGGPSTITAAAGGLDTILDTNSASINFINASARGVSSIIGAQGGTIVVAGFGATSVTSGAGPEAFLVDTSAGSVTLNGSLQTTDVFTFQKGLSAIGTGNELVTNFAQGDIVNVKGYAGFNVAATGAGSVLLLSDGSQVTFNNVSAATLAATVKPI